MSLLASISFADTFVDKRGRVIEETLEPTAESKFYEDTISDALRFVPDANTDYTQKQYVGPLKNIYTDGVIYSGDIKSEIDNNDYTMIRHTPSITDVDEDRFYLTEDYKKNRLRLTIIVSSVGEFKAKDGFYRVNGKVYYFDEDGLMVLGPAYDEIGNYYFFSYDTGELTEEIQKR